MVEQRAPSTRDETGRRGDPTDQRDPRTSVERRKERSVHAPKIVVQGLSKRFGRLIAVNDLHFSVHSGEVFGLLGSNGAGKTTTIHLMTGLLAPTTGRVIIDGIDIAKHPLDVRRVIGYLPEFPALYERLSGCEYLRLIGRLRCMDDEVIEERVAYLTELLGLTGRLDGLTGTFSRGMQQKLAYIAAVLHDPEILFLDEPTANLDPRYAKIVKDLILDARQRHRTIILSTHLTQIAQSICDRLIILDEGSIQIGGSPAEILEETGTRTLEEAFIRTIDRATQQQLAPSEVSPVPAAAASEDQAGS